MYHMSLIFLRLQHEKPVASRTLASGVSEEAENTRVCMVPLSCYVACIVGFLTDTADFSSPM